MKVVWTKEALEQLVEIEAFIARGSSARANEFVERLIKRGSPLHAFPIEGESSPSSHNLKLEKFSKRVIILSTEATRREWRF